MMKIRILAILLLFIPTAMQAQVDSTYIQSYKHIMAIHSYIAKDFLYLSQEFENGKNGVYMPNNAPKLGLGLSVNNTIINLSYGVAFDFMRDRSKGKTKSFDFQLHNYSRQFVFDLFIQKYKGFYWQDDDSKVSQFTVHPDLKVRQYGVHGQYIFNHKKYSYKAAFVQNERQLKSAGSFLIGAGAYTTEITSDSSFMYQGKRNIANFQFGVSAGYAYTWVLGKHWYIGGSAVTGIHFGSETVRKFGKQKLEVYPTVFPRASVGYHHKTSSVGFSYIGNITFPSMSNDESISIHSGSFRVSYTKRFDYLLLFQKRKKQKIQDQ